MYVAESQLPFRSSIGVATKALYEEPQHTIFKPLDGAHLVSPAPNPAKPCPRRVKRWTPFPGVGSVIP